MGDPVGLVIRMLVSEMRCVDSQKTRCMTLSEDASITKEYINTTAHISFLHSVKTIKSFKNNKCPLYTRNLSRQ